MLRHLMFAFPVAVTGIFCTPLVHAAEAPPAMVTFVEQSVVPWANAPELVAAIKAQNAAHSDMDHAQVDSLDQQWRAEVGTGSTPLIDQVLTAPASEFLRSQVAQSGGIITEAFAMDNLGLNVAASAPTSDYWQGDEAKFQKTYPVGAGTVFFDDVEFDESTQAYQGQVSLTIIDPATGAAIGAITVGLDASAFF